MKKIRGKNNEAIVFTNQIEGLAAKQIELLCDQDFVRGSKIRIMPDAHAGAGCTIGTTMTIIDKGVPNLVGVDIGCGMLVHQIKQKKVDLAALDQVIRKHVPSGFEVRESPHEFAKKVGIENLKCIRNIGMERARLSVGTLGGGNHFIEMDRDDEDNLYLVIHSGSRYLGKQIAEHYQHLAASDLMKRMPEADSVQNVMKNYTAELESELKAMQSEYTRLVQEYEAKKDQLTDLLKANKENEIRGVMERMETFQQNAQIDLQNKQSELMNVLVEKIKGIVAEIAKENKYTYIFESNGILWYSEDSEDITPLLVKKMGLK